MKRFWKYLALVAAIVAADQVTKYLVVENISLYEKVSVLPGILGLTYAQNTGAAFSAFEGQQWLFALIFALFTVALLVEYFKFPLPFTNLERWLIAAVYAGGIGNMIDRVVLGYVVDFIDVRAINFYVFNVADSFVCVGCGMILCWALYMELIAKKPAMDILFGTEPKQDDAADTDTTTTTTETTETAENTHDSE